MDQPVNKIENNLEALKDQLKNLGFQENVLSALEFYVQNPQEKFILTDKERTENERTHYTLHFEQNRTGGYELTTYDALLRICPPIPELTIKGINTAELDEVMKKFEWSVDQHTDSIIQERLQTPGGRKELGEVERIMNHIHRLHNSAQGKDVSEKLMFKYWMDTPYEPNLFSFDHLKEQHEFRCTVSVRSTTVRTKMQTYDLLKNTAGVIEKNKQSENNLLSNSIKTNVMNEQNFDYLKDNIKYMGFGENLNGQLENNLKQGKDNFQLEYNAVINKKEFEATLHFGKSANTDMYFFNRYDASLQKANGEKVDQTFYLNKEGKGITAKEAYNLLDGRAVHKDLTNKDNVPYKAWVQLDFENKDKHNNFEVKQFHENYGYDLKAAAGKYAVAELNDPEKEKSLMQSLQKGNIQSVTIEKDGNSHKMFMEANPQFKSVTLYDGQMKRVQKEELEPYQYKGQSGNKEIKQEQEKKTPVKEIQNPSAEKNKSEKNGKAIKDLLPQKEGSVKKGLSIS